MNVIAPAVAIRLGFGGARGPGKSHATFAQVALDDCRRYDGLKALYLRNKLVYKWVEKTSNEDDAIKRSVGKRTDALGKKIEAKKRLLSRHQKELDAMVSEFNG